MSTDETDDESPYMPGVYENIAPTIEAELDVDIEGESTIISTSIQGIVFTVTADDGESIYRLDWQDSSDEWGTWMFYEGEELDDTDNIIVHDDDLDEALDEFIDSLKDAQ